MGKKERLRKVVHKQAVKKISESENLKRMVSGEIMRIRSEAASHRSKLTETLSRIASEMAKLRTEVSIMTKALKENGTVTSQQLDDAFAGLQKQTQDLFDVNGQMKGNPVVTCYNTSFSVDTTNANVEYVYTLTGEANNETHQVDRT